MLTHLTNAPFDKGRRHFCAAAFMAGAMPAHAWASVIDTNSSLTVSRVIDCDWMDRSRSRAVPARLYWPATAASGSVPLVVFSHGIGGSRRGYAYLGQHLASQGWACLHVQHVGSDDIVWNGNPFSVVGRLQTAAQSAEALHRTYDLRFALDRVLKEEEPLPIDTRRIVVAGHSYGANTAMLSVGARVELDGKVLELHDDRYAAALLLSAPPFYRESDIARILQPITVPSLHITTTEDAIHIPGFQSPPSDRIGIYNAMGGEPKQLIVYNGGSHSVFTDRGRICGRSQQIKTSTKLLIHAYLRQVFDSDASQMTQWSERWIGQLARASGPFIST